MAKEERYPSQEECLLKILSYGSKSCKWDFMKYCLLIEDLLLISSIRPFEFQV